LERIKVRQIVIQNYKISQTEYIKSNVSYNLFSREQGPPAKKLVVITAIHNAVRCAMALIQKCGSGIRESFYDLCINLLNEKQLPLDTRSTSGMLCVICAKVSHGLDGWLKVII
jgi:hypothetical protein